MPGNSSRDRVGVVILAAGQSKRMGSPKLVLPWGSKTVIEQVVGNFIDCGVKPVVVVTGGAQEAIQQALVDYEVILTHNLRYAETEMMDSLRVGLQAIPEDIQAVMVALGDQPQIQANVIQALISKYLTGLSLIIVPSYEMKRGHPWLFDRSLWDEIHAFPAERSMRDFLAVHSELITYVVVETPSIISDLDTPQDYDREKPGHHHG